MPLHSHRDNDGNKTMQWHAHNPGPSPNIPPGDDTRHDISHIENEIAAVATSSKYPFATNDDIAAYIATQIGNTALPLSAVRILRRARLPREAKEYIRQRILKLQVEQNR